MKNRGYRPAIPGKVGWHSRCAFLKAKVIKLHIESDAVDAHLNQCESKDKFSQWRRVYVEKKTKMSIFCRRLNSQGGYFLVKGYWGCVARLGRIFTTGYDSNRVTFLVELLECGRTFLGFLG